MYMRRFLPASIPTALAMLTAVFCCLGTSTIAQAQDEAPKVVKGIEVEYVGPRGVSEDVIRSNMALKVGDEFSQLVVEEDIKNLYKSGIVENIRILTEPAGANGVTVIVVVQTRSQLAGVTFRGNEAFTSERLRSKVDLEVEKFVNEADVQAGLKAIQEMYMKEGFSEASVTYELRANPAGLTEVIYKIDEGGKSLLRDIEFVGNTVFSSKELTKQMKSKEISLLSKFTNSGKIRNEQLEADIVAVENYYRDHGYLNARVIDTRRVRVDDRRVDLVITIEEGELYTVGQVAIVGVRAFSVGDLSPFLKTVPGQTFSAKNLNEDLTALKDYYGSRGYADVRVVPTLDAAGATSVDITYDIYEGDKYYIRQINIVGNHKTKDSVIRNELAVMPGEVYSNPKIDASKRRLQNTGYFGNVNILPTETDSEEYKDINIHVTERSTGTLNFGAGFSSIDNFVGFVEITQTNFDIGNWPSLTGGGQRFRAAARIGTERRDLILSITEPWFMGKRLAVGGEIYYRDLFFLSDDYDQSQYGVAFNMRKPVGEHSSLSLEYTLENVEIDNISADASDLIRAEEGEYLTSEIGLNYVIDTRDDLFQPRKGHKLNAGVAYSGLGGDVSNYKLEAGGIQYFNFPFDTILSVEGHFNVVDGDDTPIFDRLFLGGANNLRGFDYRDVGPRDETGEPLGGLTSAYASTEFTIPVMRQLRFALFYDIGVVSAESYDLSATVNANYGIGLRLFLPIGPLRLDYGIPVASDEFNDNSGRFNFNIGYKF